MSKHCTDPGPIIQARQTLITENVIESRIADDDDFIACVISILYANQTEDEQEHGRTRHKNGVGLSASDAPFYTKLYCKLALQRPLEETDLSRLRMPRSSGPSGLRKYARQIRRILTGGME